jgi:hypothetical protein
MDVKIGRNCNKPSDIASRIKYFEWLTSKIEIPGIVLVERDTSFDDEKLLRNAGIRLRYESHFDVLGDVKDGVLLEVGFDDTAPNQEVLISSWAFDYALQQSASVMDNRAYGAKCYSPEYTFVEKLQTISTKFRQQQEKGTMISDLLRHYYDVYQLLALTEVQNFIGTPTYEERKRKRFRKGDTLRIAENEAFLLRDPGLGTSMRQSTRRPPRYTTKDKSHSQIYSRESKKTLTVSNHAQAVDFLSTHPRHGVHVLVPSAAEAHEDNAVLRQRRGKLADVVDGVGRLKRGDDPLCAGEQVESL